ncbi:MAG: polyisoprenoid-binding protein [Alphaproteobacteria bacterium]|nr:polyisoprenoid-binding protein [Alphaproteobacteria bacterium]
MRQLAALVLPLALVGSCTSMIQAKQTLQTVGSGQYTLEKPHGSIVWRVMHMGLSHYTARLTDWDATLDFDPKNPAASHIKAIINPLSVSAEHPTDKDWNRHIGEDFLLGKEFPQIVFESTKVEPTGEFTGKVTGNLSFAGMTHPVTLDVTYNGAIASSPFFGGRSLVGFSARGVIKRSEWGVTNYASIVSDDVEIIIEAEFVKAG